MENASQILLNNIQSYLNGDNEGPGLNTNFSNDIINVNVERERLSERLQMNLAANQIIDMFNDMIIKALNGFQQRNSNILIKSADEGLSSIVKEVENILVNTRQDVNIRRLNNISKSAENYAMNMKKIAADIEYIAQHAANRVVLYNNVKDGAGEFAQTISGAAARRTAGLATGMVSSVNLIIWLLIASIILGLTLAWLITSGIVKPVSIIINDLASGSNEVASASGQVSSSGQELAKNANEQASSLEETSASLEELASMTKQNTENARQVNIMSSEAKESSVKGRDTVEKMTVAITKIKESSDETVKIIKTIDEIAFQTNLLALNAAVEAARAGEAGKGFAVVAEEVRNLAQRAGEAAKNTAVLIDESKNNSEQGVKVAEEVSTILGDITGKIIKMNELAVEVASASEEQTKGIDQINTAVSQIEKITQANAANSEESAAASEELTAQSEKLLEYVEVLRDIVYGENHNGNEAGMKRERSARETGLNRGKTANKTGMNLKQKTIAKTTPKATAKHTTKTKAEEIIPLDDSDF
jgi:methyl-accepting chemotaxis protein